MLLTMHFPCTHFNPASMMDHLEESIMMGTRAISGSVAIRLRNFTMAASPSSMPSSMFTSMICAPPRTCSKAISTASPKLFSRIRRRNLRLPVTLVRSPIFMKLESGRITNGSSPLNARRVESNMHGRRCGAGRENTGRVIHANFRQSADVFGGGAAASAYDVDQTVTAKASDELRHFFRALVVFAEFVRQAGIGMGADCERGLVRQNLQIGSKLFRAQGAIEPDGEQGGVGQRDQKGLGSLAGKSSAACVGNGARYHDGNGFSHFVEHFFDGEQGRFGVEGV